MTIGAILGDFAGSRFEKHNITVPPADLIHERCFFTDDSVLTVATAEALLTDGDYAAAYRRYVQRHPHAGYGPRFAHWARARPPIPAPMSAGNGAAMRVSPVAWAFDSLPEVRAEARRSAGVSHADPEAILAAEAIAGATFILRRGGDVIEACELATALGLALDGSIADWRARPTRRDFTARNTAPVAFAALRQGHDTASALGLAISTGGDSDTIAAMAGSLAEAHFGVPPALVCDILARLEGASPTLHATITGFRARFGSPALPT